MFNVTKADGSRQPFDRGKLVRTCLRMRSSIDVAVKVADLVEPQLYEGIPTKQILKLVFKYVTKYRPSLKQQIDLREAIALLRPKPDFEQFVSLLLKAEGYSVKTNQIISGECIEHEIDSLASKKDERIYVEVKHHYNPHSYTGLDVFLTTQAVLEDLRQGGSNLSRAMVVTNAKLSEHARRYAECKKISAIGWRYPDGHGLEDMIESSRLYPITLMKGLVMEIKDKLTDNRIVLINQLIEYDADDLAQLIKIGKNTCKELLGKAHGILQS